jgi:hypothetical protein
MKSMLKLAVTFLLLSMPMTHAQSAYETEAKPFHISSRGSAYGVQGEFEGTYRVYDSSIEVYVSKATLYVSEHCPYQGRRRINYIKFGLWNQESSEWRVQNSPQSLYLYLVMSPREEHPLADLHFSLPKQSTLDLGKRWLVVEIQEDTLDASPLEAGWRGYAFVHSCKDIFAKGDSIATEQKTPCQ